MKNITIKFAADHATAAGHFPGNPIIPGALLLAEVLRAIAQVENLQIATCNVKSAKFQHPARPGDTVVINYSHTTTGAIDFKCSVTEIKVLSGLISTADHE